MKKIKLFLLTGIVSILSIGCFTNAIFDYDNVVTFTYNGSSFFPSSFDFSDPLSSYDINLINIDTKCIVLFGNSNGGSNGRVYFNRYSGRPVYSQLGDRSGVSIIQVDAGDCSGLKFTMSKKSSYLPVSALTPAINGLHDTVREIIPYIVYIGIGVLLAILGFYAVRWLVNRLARKINSVFRSKRS